MSEKKQRIDSWTEQQDERLAEIVLQFLRDGKTLNQAYVFAADEFERTESAVQFRWNQVLRKNYAKAVTIAKQHGKKLKEQLKKKTTRAKKKVADKTEVEQVEVVNVAPVEETTNSPIVDAVSVATTIDEQISVSESVPAEPVILQEEVIENIPAEPVALQEAINDTPEVNEEIKVISPATATPKSTNDAADFVSIMTNHLKEFSELQTANSKLETVLNEKDMELKVAMAKIQDLESQITANTTSTVVPEDYETIKEENLSLKQELAVYKKLRQAMWELEPMKDQLKSAVTENKVG